MSRRPLRIGLSARIYHPQAGATRVRDTVVADAGTYAGVVPLAQAAAVGDFTLRATGVYTQLVPARKPRCPWRRSCLMPICKPPCKAWPM